MAIASLVQAPALFELRRISARLRWVARKLEAEIMSAMSIDPSMLLVDDYLYKIADKARLALKCIQGIGQNPDVEIVVTEALASASVTATKVAKWLNGQSGDGMLIRNLLQEAVPVFQATLKTLQEEDL